MDDRDGWERVEEGDSGFGAAPTSHLVIERQLTLSRPAQLAVLFTFAVIAIGSYTAGQQRTSPTPTPTSTTSTVRPAPAPAATVPTGPGLAFDLAGRHTHRTPDGASVESMRVSCLATPFAPCSDQRTTVRLAYAYDDGAGSRDGIAWITYDAESSALLRGVPWAPDRGTSAPVELSVIATSAPVARVRLTAVGPDGEPVVDEQAVDDNGVVAFADAPDVRHLTVDGLDADGHLVATCAATTGQACGTLRIGPAHHGPSPTTFDRSGPATAPAR